MDNQRSIQNQMAAILKGIIAALVVFTATAGRAQTSEGGLVPFVLESFRLAVPTGQLTLDGSVVSNVFMHTGSGDPRNGLYGFTRLANDGKPRFHEGIDIAPLKRDKRNVPLDDVRAAANGEVVYINGVPGRSNYGRYVVLSHTIPLPRESNTLYSATQTQIYTLYSHLASIASGLKTGQSISSGTVVGRLGNSPDIPLARAHLHFECGLIQNSEFRRWFQMDAARAKALAEKTAKHTPKPRVPPTPPPDHGMWNGQNLMGLNPCELFAMRDEEQTADIFRHISMQPIAFSIACESRQIPDYFRRYPNLWFGPPFRPGLIRLDVDETGVVLRGSNHSGAGEDAVILGVDDTLPGVEGRRLISRTNDRWQLTSSGKDWLEIFLFHP